MIEPMGICAFLFSHLLFKCNSILVGFENLNLRNIFKIWKRSEHLEGLSISF